MDVTKQADMTGFYRNLYKQTVGTDEQTKVKEEPHEDDSTRVVKQEIEVSEGFKQKTSRNDRFVLKLINY